TLRLAQVLDHDRKHARRNREVVKRPLRLAERLAQLGEGGALAIVAINVAQQADEARHRLLVAGRHECLETVAHAPRELLGLPAGARHPDDGHAEQPAAHQVIERRIDLAIAQIAGGAEQDNGIAIAPLHNVLRPASRDARRSPSASPTAAYRRIPPGPATRSASTTPRSARRPARPPRWRPARSSVPRPSPTPGRRSAAAWNPPPAPPRSDRAGATR